MQIHVHIKMNPSLFIKDPEQSELGRKIIKYSINIIEEIGFEDFTFRKLAKEVGTTEASIYRYFENKHRLLSYSINWFWTWLEYQIVFYSNNIKDPKEKIKTIIDLILFELEDNFMVEHIDTQKLHNIIVSEGNKLYLTKHVDEDNKVKMFQPYKDLCNRIADVFTQYNPQYAFPHSLASSLIEAAHHQLFFSEHLPSLTDFDTVKDKKLIKSFLTNMTFSSLDK